MVPMLTRPSALIVACSLLVLSGVACSAPEPGDLGSATEDVTQVCGAKTNGPVQGVDVSHYQGNFDWTAAKVDFGYAQVSDGVTSPDPMFDTNWANMKKAHVLRGAYQFFRPNEDEVAQANLLVKKVGKLAPGDLPAMIDVEVTGGEPPAVIAAKVAKWIQVVHAGTRVRPFIYSGSYFWQDHVVSTAFGATPIWIAAYGSTCPSVPPGWKNWLFWQYSDGNGKLDHNVFNGTLAQLRALSPASTSAPDAGVHDAGVSDASAAHDAAVSDASTPHDAGGLHDAAADAEGPEVVDMDAAIGPSEPESAAPPDVDAGQGDAITAPAPVDAPHTASGCALGNTGGANGGASGVFFFAAALLTAARRRSRQTHGAGGQ